MASEGVGEHPRVSLPTQTPKWLRRLYARIGRTRKRKFDIRPFKQRLLENDMLFFQIKNYIVLRSYGAIESRILQVKQISSSSKMDCFKLIILNDSVICLFRLYSIIVYLSIYRLTITLITVH